MYTERLIQTYGCKCDSCGKEFISDDGEAFYVNDADLEEELYDASWYTSDKCKFEDHLHWCPDCHIITYEVDDLGNNLVQTNPTIDLIANETEKTNLFNILESLLHYSQRIKIPIKVVINKFTKIITSFLKD